MDCPVSYLPGTFNIDFDRTADTLGPYGESARATVQNGKCARDSTFFSDADVKTLGDCVGYIFDDNVAGQFLWTARNELEDKWSYKNAYDKGWLTSRKAKSFLQ